MLTNTKDLILAHRVYAESSSCKTYCKRTEQNVLESSPFRSFCTSEASYVTELHFSWSFQKETVFEIEPKIGRTVSKIRGTLGMHRLSELYFVYRTALRGRESHSCNISTARKTTILLRRMAENVQRRNSPLAENRIGDFTLPPYLIGHSVPLTN